MSFTTRQIAEAHTYEYLSREIASQTKQSYNAAQDLAAKTSGQSTGRSENMRGIYDMSLYLLSSHRSSADFERGEITWTIPPFNSDQPIINCIQVQMSRLTIPRIYDYVSKHEQYIGRRVYVEIVELPAGSGVRASDGTRFHFECSVYYSTPEYVSLQPLGNTILLTRPLPVLDSVTLRFYQRDPYNKRGLKRVRLFKDVIQVQLVPGSFPAGFIVQPPDDVWPVGPPESAFVSPAIEVYVNGITTNSPAFNAQLAGPYYNIQLIDAVGPDGVARGMATDTTMSAIPVTSGDLIGDMYIPKNVIGAILRFTCLDSGPTNYIKPVHV